MEIGWLKREPSSSNEIRGLLSIVARRLADANVSAISVHLRASGYRTATQAGHHLRTIESLEFTMQADATHIQRLKAFNNKRNESS